MALLARRQDGLRPRPRYAGENSADSRRHASPVAIGSRRMSPASGATAHRPRSESTISRVGRDGGSATTYSNSIGHRGPEGIEGAAACERSQGRRRCGRGVLGLLLGLLALALGALEVLAGLLEHVARATLVGGGAGGAVAGVRLALPDVGDHLLRPLDPSLRVARPRSPLGLALGELGSSAYSRTARAWPSSTEPAEAAPAPPTIEAPAKATLAGPCQADSSAGNARNAVETVSMEPASPEKVRDTLCSSPGSRARG